MFSVLSVYDDLPLQEKKINVHVSKEWKNTIYSFNKEILANIPTLTQNVNKIIKSFRIKMIKLKIITSLIIIIIVLF